jgi:hypothetical protein
MTLLFGVWNVGTETAGPSTALRSGRDDTSVWVWNVGRKQQVPPVSLYAFSGGSELLRDDFYEDAVW